MLFDSPIYLLTLTVVVLAYWRLNHDRQNSFLLAFSYFFYGWWDWRFLTLIAISTLVDYFCARAVAGSSSQTRRRLALALSVGLNLAFLGFFKYFNFFVESLHALLLALGIESERRVLEILLPPGISFYTFQAIAYMVDVYRGRIPVARSLRDYALFISLFPHLIAGPIQRPDHLLPQVQKERYFDSTAFSNGILLILSGLFRKCVIADNCALLANAAFGGTLGPPSVAVVAIGTWAFAWQIYGDFSGYSNIARGSAQLLGFHFMVNFRAPYLAISLQDFWRRWHISLSSWLRDYLYFSLGGNRLGLAKTYRNLMVTMLLGGLWHGANWTFVVWGGLHGAWLAFERAIFGERGPPKEGRRALRQWLQRIAIFHIVCLSWVFFRATSLEAAFTFLGGLGHWRWQPEYASALVLLFLPTSALMVIDLLEERRGEEVLTENGTPSSRAAFAAIVLVLTLLFSASQTSAFIYFQF